MTAFFITGVASLSNSYTMVCVPMSEGSMPVCGAHWECEEPVHIGSMKHLVKLMEAHGIFAEVFINYCNA